MRREHLVFRGLTFYWRTHLAVVLGVATSVAVLAGALLVGTSVRASLRDLLLAQIGRTDEVVAAQHFFTEALGSSIEGDTTFATAFQHMAPLIVARGIVTSQDSQRRAGDVTVYGVDDRFWRFHGVAITGPGARAAHVSEALASQLHVSANGTLVVRLQRVTDVPIESLHGRKEDVGRSLRVTVASVLTRDTLGDFSLTPSQSEVRAVFLPLALLQDQLDAAGRVNTLLASHRPGAAVGKEALPALVRAHATLADAGITVTVVDAAHTLVVGSSGNGGSQSSSVGESVMPGNAGDRSRPPAAMGTTPATVNVAVLVTRRPGSSHA